MLLAVNCEAVYFGKTNLQLSILPSCMPTLSGFTHCNTLLKIWQDKLYFRILLQDTVVKFMSYTEML